ncbi:MAG: class I SAM-dependent methyltransferase [bacterium]
MNSEMNSLIQRETAVHGEAWHSIHGGYFSDPVVAAPLVSKVAALAAESRAERIIDLGGGNGYMLGQLKAAGIGAGVKLINLESSEPQILAAARACFDCIRGSVDAFSRSDFGAEDTRHLFTMRSVLHYFGKEGLLPVIRHVRRQTRPGEFWVHQTASFQRVADAGCLNTIYSMMKTSKWYPTTGVMKNYLVNEGWNVLEVLPCEPLPLTSASLAMRYGLSVNDVADIREQLAADVQVPDNVLTFTDNTFCAYLHYWLYVCTPSIR